MEALRPWLKYVQRVQISGRELWRARQYSLIFLDQMAPGNSNAEYDENCMRPRCYGQTQDEKRGLLWPDESQ